MSAALARHDAAATEMEISTDVDRHRTAACIQINRSSSDRAGIATGSRAVGQIDCKPTIDQLWHQYKANPTRQMRDRLVEHYMHCHVRPIAERLHARLPAQVDVDDLVQQGYVGLAESIERFEPTRSIRFETFSGRRIYGSMRDYLRQLDHAPRLTRRREKQLLRETEDFQKKHGRAPDEQELFERLDMPRDRFQRFNAERPPLMVHFNAARSETPEFVDSDGMRSFEDQRDPEPSVRAEMNDLRHWITRGFSRPDQLIIVLYYYEKLTMREVGQTLGISESRVSQRLDSIIKCLRARLAETDAETEFQFRS